MVRQTTKLRELLATNDYLVAPCAYDALSARAIQAAGFKIAGTTGMECTVQSLASRTQDFLH